MWRIFLSLVMFLPAQPVLAQWPLVEATCDAQFHGSLKDRAWMQAQREYEVAQTLLTGGESVLDYTCFPNAVALAGASQFGVDTPGAIDSILTGAEFGCESMAQVWSTFRCSDVDPQKFFPQLGEMASNDLRSCNKPVRDVMWEAAYQLSYQAESGIERIYGIANSPTQLETLFSMMNPADCSASAFVKTGLKSLDGETDAAVCMAPGCFYDGSGCVSQ